MRDFDKDCCSANKDCDCGDPDKLSAESSKLLDILAFLVKCEETHQDIDSLSVCA